MGTFRYVVYITLSIVERYFSKNLLGWNSVGRCLSALCCKTSRARLLTDRGRDWSKWMREAAGMFIPLYYVLSACSTFCHTSPELFSVLCTLLYHRLSVFSSKNQFRMEQHSRVSSRPLLITPRGRYWSKWMREVAGLLIPFDNCVCTCSTFCRTSSELFSVLCTLLYQRLTIFFQEPI